MNSVELNASVMIFLLSSLPVFKQVGAIMAGAGFSSVTEQVVRHLEEELRRGRWRREMPGRGRLVAELGVSGKTVELALKRLEERGLLDSAGTGRRRRIAEQVVAAARPALRVGILPYEPADRGAAHLISLQHRLEEAGHVAWFAPRTLVDLRRDVKRVSALVERGEADAWVVVSGPRAVLEWFLQRKVPVFALFGRRQSLEIAGAGPNKEPALREVVARLVGLGHRRIVMVSREERRKPYPGRLERAFLDELAAHGLPTGDFNLPDWEETPEGFRACLDRLFQHTPPTALILDESYLLTVAQQHLAQRGWFAPKDVSLVSCDPDPLYPWLRPAVTHIRWDAQPVVRRIVRWVEGLARGKDDRRQTEVRAVFVEGETIGRCPSPAPDRGIEPG